MGKNAVNINNVLIAGSVIGGGFLLWKAGQIFNLIPDKSEKDQKRNEEILSPAVQGNLSPFSPQYYKAVAPKTPKNAAVYNYEGRKKIATALNEAETEQEGVGAFHQIRSKQELSMIAETYYNLFKKDLFLDLQAWGSQSMLQRPLTWLFHNYEAAYREILQYIQRLPVYYVPKIGAVKSSTISLSFDSPDDATDWLMKTKKNYVPAFKSKYPGNERLNGNR